MVVFPYSFDHGVVMSAISSIMTSFVYYSTGTKAFFWS